VGAHGERCGFAVFVFQCGKICFPRLTLADEQHSGFGQRPAQMHGANLFARGAQFFATGFFGAFHQPTIGDKILHAGKARAVLNLIENDQGKDLADARDGLEPGERLAIIGFGTARKIEFDFTESLIVVIDP